MKFRFCKHSWKVVATETTLLCASSTIYECEKCLKQTKETDTYFSIASLY